MIRPVLCFPHERLLQVPRPIHDFDDRAKKDLAALCQDLRDTAEACGAPSFCAPMIMSQWRVIYIAPKVCGTHLFLVNPMVVHHGAIFQHMMETCPSVPGVELDIQRWAMVTVAARKPDGDSIMIPFSGIEAQAVQHEMQHLRGECIIDSALSGKRLFLKEKVAKYGGKYGSVLRYDQTIVER